MRLVPDQRPPCDIVRTQSRSVARNSARPLPEIRIAWPHRTQPGYKGIPFGLACARRAKSANSCVSSVRPHAEWPFDGKALIALLGEELTRARLLETSPPVFMVRGYNALVESRGIHCISGYAIVRLDIPL